MSIKTLVRVDVLTYLLALISLLFAVNLKQVGIDVQLYDTYYTFNFSSFYLPLAILLLFLGAFYSFFIVRGNLPHAKLSMSFIVLISISIACFNVFFYGYESLLFNIINERKYYSQTEITPGSIFDATLSIIALLLGLLAYIISLIKANKVQPEL